MFSAKKDEEMIEIMENLKFYEHQIASMLKT